MPYHPVKSELGVPQGKSEDLVPSLKETSLTWGGEF